MVEFVFTEDQRQLALREAQRRQEYNEKRRFKGRSRAPAKGKMAEEMHMLGAAAEVAAAVYLNAEKFLFLDEAPIRGSCDIPGIDVKCRSRHNSDLLVQLDDNLNKMYVLVTIQNKKTYIHGFIDGIDVPTLGEIKELVPGRPCYVVPRFKLHPIADLRKTYDAEKIAREPIGTIWK